MARPVATMTAAELRSKLIDLRIAWDAASNAVPQGMDIDLGNAVPGWIDDLDHELGIREAELLMRKAPVPLSRRPNVIPNPGDAR